MEARVQKWGNSLALRIPKPFATEAGIEEDSSVRIELVEGRLSSLLLSSRIQPWKNCWRGSPRKICTGK